MNLPGKVIRLLLLMAFAAVIQACDPPTPEDDELDVLIVNGLVYDGSLDSPSILAVGIKADRIVYLGDAAADHPSATVVLDAEGLFVTPGFIDPHTHALDDIIDASIVHNSNYLTQGVTTVIAGNDGGGSFEIAQLASQIKQSGVGTNVGLLVGHNEVRRAVMGEENRRANADELDAMAALVRAAMEQGALGMSSGLYYTPGRFAAGSEVAQLASVVAEFDGLYDTHIRDESSFSIGLVASIAEAIEIGMQSGAAVNISHIKALGVDVWGESATVIALINEARRNGVAVTADQYPWLASGTSIENALVRPALPSDASSNYPDALQALSESQAGRARVAENLRRRGGPDSVLLTAVDNEMFVGLTLADLAAQLELSVIDTVFHIEQHGGASIASFNMRESDLELFMQQPWVMTSSDGSTGHPRKFASHARKFRDFVADTDLLSVEEFVHRSSQLVAETFKLQDRGTISIGSHADIAMIDPDNYRPLATFSEPTLLSTGVEYLLVNGRLVISEGRYSGALSGRVLSRAGHSLP